MAEYIKVQLGSSFLLNAGLCGFVRFLEHNNAVKEQDYIINNQGIDISTDYIVNNNIPEKYVETVVSLFEAETKYHRVICEESKLIEGYTNRFDELDKKELKNLSDLYKNFEDMMLKASFKTGYEISKSYDNITHVTEDMINTLKRVKDLKEKYKLHSEILKLLEQKEIKNILIFKELTYSKLKLFFGDSVFSLKTNASKSGESIFDKDFYQPLLKEIEAEEKKKKKLCIECMNQASSTTSISFMIDTTDDVNRKKSYYWNCKPDAYVCPVCAFIYSFIPLGFAFIGAESVFINSNGNVKTMIDLMNTYHVKKDEKEENEKKQSKKKRIYRAFTSEKIDMFHNKLSNIQVIVRSPEYDHFQFSIIDRDIVEKLEKGKKYLGCIEKIWVKKDTSSDVFLSVYDEVMDCITSKKSFYPLISMLLKTGLSTETSIGYLGYVLKLHIIFNGGVKEMDNLNKNVDIAFMSGRELRKIILGNENEEDDDNKLRGTVYRLANLASVGDVSQFIDTVIRVYSGYGTIIPSVFKECYKSEELFKAIAHGFILGLKNVKYNKEDTNNG